MERAVVSAIGLGLLVSFFTAGVVALMVGAILAIVVLVLTLAGLIYFVRLFYGVVKSGESRKLPRVFVLALTPAAVIYVVGKIAWTNNWTQAIHDWIHQEVSSNGPDLGALLVGLGKMVLMLLLILAYGVAMFIPLIGGAMLATAGATDGDAAEMAAIIVPIVLLAAIVAILSGGLDHFLIAANS